MGVSAPSLHRESTDSLIGLQYGTSNRATVVAAIKVLVYVAEIISQFLSVLHIISLSWYVKEPKQLCPAL